MNQIINMIIRQFINRGINMGVRKGADMMARRGEQPDDPQAAREQDRTARDSAKKANRMVRLMRRIMRF